MKLAGAQHLRRSADFEAIRTQSVGGVCEAFRMRLRMTQTGMRRLGVISSKRVGNAVARNRARRLMREAFRNNQGILPPSCDVLMIASGGILVMGEAQVEALYIAQTEKCLRRQAATKNDAGVK